MPVEFFGICERCGGGFRYRGPWAGTFDDIHIPRPHHCPDCEKGFRSTVWGTPAEFEFAGC